MRFFIKLSRSLSFKMKQREAPIWLKPTNNSTLPDLKLYNSLTNKKDNFIPKTGKKVEWYSCGPTVYDVSHMGHARTYISIDILRRVLRDYFKFDIHFVMNITDIDDKIIKRARQNYLYEAYVKAGDCVKLRADLKATVTRLESRLTNETDDDRKRLLSSETEAVKVVLKNTGLTMGNLEPVRDAFSDMLDKREGSSVTDNAIFEALPKKFEDEFHTDMKRLHVLPPDELTRVSEYVPQIVEYIAEIERRGLAYKSAGGSVYFDTTEFDSADEHYYAKLVPTAYGNEVLLREGEGVLASTETGEKRSETDFALWKASKPGEPSWDSPWGRGRPGWHIECSAMASDKCGETLDIHTGGVDLRFPHHDNEMAQAEARHDCQQWVNYFLHTGHLTISGCKMSKSLKNFVSIRQVLESHSWRQLRIAFLQHSWRDTLDYSPDTMTAACAYEKTVLDFVYLVNLACPGSGSSAESELAAVMEAARSRIHGALCDSVDTRDCLFVLKDVMEKTTAHVQAHGIANCDGESVQRAGRMVLETLAMFGAAPEEISLDGLEAGLGLSLEQYDRDALVAIAAAVMQAGLRFCEDVNGVLAKHGSDKCPPEVMAAVTRYQESGSVDKGLVKAQMKAAAALRAAVRSGAIGAEQGRTWRGPLLAVCDRLRDEWLAAAGVRLQDNGDDGYAVGLMPSWTYVVSSQQAPAAKKKQPSKASRGGDMDASAAIEPHLWFQCGKHEGGFSRYDEAGLPTHSCDGMELTKSNRKTLAKEQATQQRAHSKWILQQQKLLAQ